MSIVKNTEEEIVLQAQERLNEKTMIKKKAAWQVRNSVKMLMVRLKDKERKKTQGL